MKRTIRNNINSPYTLHDMNVFALEVSDNDIVIKTQSGIVETTSPYRQLDGYVEFHNVQWDFCYVYLLGVTGNIGIFTGEKMFLKDFINRYKQFGFSIMDETYGYNMTKYNGYLLSNRQHCECVIEIYHEGDMVFVVDEEIPIYEEDKMKNDIDFTTITACGECCVGCKKKEDGICQGCIESDGHCMEWEQSNGCPIHKCAREHNVQFCGLCEEFPCEWLIQKVVWRKNVVEELTELANLYYK